MSRQFPTIQLFQDEFQIDVARGYLRWVVNPAMVIDLANTERQDLDQATYRNFQRFLYNTQTRQQYVPSPGQARLPEHVQYLEIPSDFLLDIVRYAQRYGHQVFAEAAAGQQEYVARIIPRVDIYGHEFFIDTVNWRLQHVSDRDNIILLKDTVMTPHSVLFEFDPISGRQAMGLAEDMEEAIVVVVHLAPIRQLDKAGWDLRRGDTSMYNKQSPAKPVKTTRRPRRDGNARGKR